MRKAVGYGILSCFFFSFTFLLNRSMNLAGGYWMWTASLRYLFTLPILTVILLVMPGHKIKPVVDEIKKDPASWFLWSTVGFGMFYLPLTLASVYGESWFTAASWQVTIVAGVLLTPLFGKKIPLKNLAMSFIILTGVLILQIPNVTGDSAAGNLKALFFIIIAAFSYPLGNREMMRHCPDDIDSLQRTFGMDLCSMPFWIIIALTALIRSGLPSAGQTVQSLAVGIFSGIIATALYFHATDMVKGDQRKLAAVEATECCEVIFTLIGGVLILGDRMPNTLGFVGLVLIIGGMIADSLLAG